MKSYTDLEQSRKLAEILPLESANMCYIKREINDTFIETPIVKPIGGIEKSLCCWSLAALLDVLPKTINHNTLFIETSPALWHIGYRGTYIARSENLIDVCVEMVLKLRELNLL